LKNKGNNFSNRLGKSILYRLLTALVIYTIAGILCYLAAVWIVDMRTWFSEEFLYAILRWLNARRVVFAVLYIVVGYLAIFLYYWRKPFSYIQEMADALEQVYQSDHGLIELSDELKEIEAKMNRTKLSIKENERIAKEAEQRKNDLVVYLAHDLKTPLTSVIGYLTLLRDEAEISQELREKYLSISLDKAERLEDLINEFFEITRFNLSNITLEVSKVNLTRMLEQITFEFKPMLAEKGLDCVLTADSEISIKCDVDKMQRVFDNLLRNAVNYSFENSKIHIIVKQESGEVKIRFQNQGNTIPEEKLQRIFEQFYRLDTARTTKSGGAGLGLAIAKEIVELHGGRILANSQNEEIVFELMIPIL
jgi:two-component system, OmpR family, sensor histidine kinase VanS